MVIVEKHGKKSNKIWAKNEKKKYGQTSYTFYTFASDKCRSYWNNNRILILALNSLWIKKNHRVSIYPAIGLFVKSKRWTLPTEAWEKLWLYLAVEVMIYGKVSWFVLFLMKWQLCLVPFGHTSSWLHSLRLFAVKNSPFFLGGQFSLHCSIPFFEILSTIFLHSRSKP